MLDNVLKQKLRRTMTSGDLCNTRILHYIPALLDETSNYMVESKIYDYDQAFLDVVKIWSKNRIEDISKQYDYSSKVTLAITEIKYFYNVICTMYEDFKSRNFKNIIEYCMMVEKISLANYLDIVKICGPTPETLISKLAKRERNFKKKFDLVLKRRITIEDFYKKEILPQMEQLAITVERLNQFEKEQFPIFIICYDLKKLHSIANHIGSGYN